MKTALVCGAGGFIGSHLVNRLKSEGYWVRGVDLKRPEFSDTQADEFLLYDLRDPRNMEAVMRIDWDVNGFPALYIMPFSFIKQPFSINSKQNGFDEVYQLAADMGGAGYIFTGEHDAEIMHNSATINLNVAKFAIEYGVKKLFYSSSACMYPKEIQNDYQNPGLKESDAYPANPDSEYGWEKLFSERLFLAYQRNNGLNVRIARFHNIYGPEGTYQGGREKAPAAMCRKVIEGGSKNLSKEKFDEMTDRWYGGWEIEIWGTGHQTRSFLFIDDCIDAVRLLMKSDFSGPVNIGSEEMVTINQLAEIAIGFSGTDITIKHIDGPIGVIGRNSNNELIEEKLGWKPKFTLNAGLFLTYNWIKKQYDRNI